MLLAVQPWQSSLPALGCVESPDNRLKSSKAEAAEVGAEDTEEVALLAARGADGPEIREQPRRESSAVRGSETSQDRWTKEEVFLWLNFH